MKSITSYDFKRTRFIKIVEKQLYLSPHFSIPIEHSNLPAASLSFSSHLATYFYISIVSFDKSKKELYIEVLDYNPKDVSNFDQQKVKREIKTIFFMPLHYASIRACLSYYSRADLEDVLMEKEKEVLWQPTHFEHLERLEKSKKEETYKIQVRVSDLQFHLGKVSFDYKIKGHDQPLVCSIYNENILAEFEYIKYYFSKIWNRKTIDVKLTIEETNFSSRLLKAESPQIASINSSFLQTVKDYRAALFSSFEPTDTQKETFSAEDFLNEVENGKNAHESQLKESDILDFFTDQEQVRNKHQLIYLSGHIQSEAYSMKFTPKPNFGFLFISEGKEMNHVIWELLNSNATYIWSATKETTIPNLIKSIEIEISMIKQLGRMKYKSNYHLKRSDQGFLFQSIPHKYINHQFKDGFTYWKYKLESIMI